MHVAWTRHHSAVIAAARPCLSPYSAVPHANLQKPSRAPAHRIHALQAPAEAQRLVEALREGRHKGNPRERQQLVRVVPLSPSTSTLSCVTRSPCSERAHTPCLVRASLPCARRGCKRLRRRRLGLNGRKGSDSRRREAAPRQAQGRHATNRHAAARSVASERRLSHRHPHFS